MIQIRAEGFFAQSRGHARCSFSSPHGVTGSPPMPFCLYSVSHVQELPAIYLLSYISTSLLLSNGLLFHQANSQSHWQPIALVTFKHEELSCAHLPLALPLLHHIHAGEEFGVALILEPLRSALPAQGTAPVHASCFVFGVYYQSTASHTAFK